VSSTVPWWSGLLGARSLARFVLSLQSRQIVGSSRCRIITNCHQKAKDHQQLATQSRSDKANTYTQLALINIFAIAYKREKSERAMPAAAEVIINSFI